MKRVYPVLLIVVFLLASAHALLADCPEKADGWKLKKDKNGTCIYNREKEGSEVKELLTITTINRPVWRLAAAVGDYDHFKEFMPYTVGSKCLKSIPLDEKTSKNYFFTLLDIPLVSNRYYTLELVDQWDAEGPGSFRSKWTMSKDPAVDPAWNDPSVAAELPDGYSEPIKTPVNDGFWLFEPMGDGSSSRITYYVYTHPGGKIPSWIANQANSVAVPKLMKALKERSADARYNAKAPK